MQKSLLIHIFLKMHNYTYQIKASETHIHYIYWDINHFGQIVANFFLQSETSIDVSWVI